MVAELGIILSFFFNIYKQHQYQPGAITRMYIKRRDKGVAFNRRCPILRCRYHCCSPASYSASLSLQEVLASL
jgi:hypothetical protein